MVRDFGADGLCRSYSPWILEGIIFYGNSEMSDKEAPQE